MEKKRFLAGSMSIALAVTMFSTTAFAASVKFTDVPSSHWASSSIYKMADKGIMSGIGNNLFAPSQQLSNAEFITMLVRQFYSDKLGAEGSTWYAPFMAAAKSANILAGTNVTATSTINRYDMAQLMYNVLKAEGITTSSLSDTSKVADWSAVPSTYRDAVSVCYNMGMLTGVDNTGTFNGTGNMDRAQAAVVMDRLLEVCSGGTPSTPKPTGSTSITKLDQTMGGHGAVETDGGFFFDSSKVAMGCSSLSLETVGYTRITFTVKAIDIDVQVSAGHAREGVSIADPNKQYRELLGVVPAGSSKSFTIDCSADESVSIAVADNNHINEYGFSDIFVECYLLDLTIS
ncbi:S-layer homology domain-containing protein [Flavonifractor plautii]|uniref:S-layer homology domain-containing protein n=1 Tax=Flavonifractor plautii TaxID=292800 RepID=UPI00356ACADE